MAFWRRVASFEDPTICIEKYYTLTFYNTFYNVYPA
jgi:hypothetical protein